MLTLNELGFICNVHPSMSCWKYFSRFIIYKNLRLGCTKSGLLQKYFTVNFKYNFYLNYRGHPQR
ncbi:unnamed protein product [Prunus brigantina]